jgi:hypothetical protein
MNESSTILNKCENINRKIKQKENKYFFFSKESNFQHSCISSENNANFFFPKVQQKPSVSVQAVWPIGISDWPNFGAIRRRIFFRNTLAIADPRNREVPIQIRKNCFFRGFWFPWHFLDFFFYFLYSVYNADSRIFYPDSLGPTLRPLWTKTFSHRLTWENVFLFNALS